MKFGFDVLAAMCFLNPMFGTDIPFSEAPCEDLKKTPYSSFIEKWDAWKVAIQTPAYHDSILKESLWDAVDGYNLPLLEFLLENQSSRFKELVGQDFGQISEKIFSSSSSTKSQDLQDAFEAHEQRFSEQNPVNQRNDQGQTLLMKAADRVDSRIVQMLLERQADPNLTDNDGNSALIIASSTRFC